MCVRVQKRDDLTANAALRVLGAHASGLVGKGPVFGRTRTGHGFAGDRLRCKTRQAVQACLGFCALSLIPKNHAARGASYAEHP